MLALAAAQLSFQARRGALSRARSIWIDMGGGTGWNIEAMQAYVDVASFFSEVYLVDLSPSLCAVARKRFARLGWDNVKVVCQDARLFHLEGEKAELVTMSYSLSMMPNFHVFVDAAASLLDARGIIGVADFYVQSSVETVGRNYLGGCIQRHVNWISRTFWRAWFELDRVSLEGARRDYLEYRFGTIKTLDERNYVLGNFTGVCIPYYIFLGCPVASTNLRKELERLDADYTESPYLSPRQVLEKQYGLSTAVRSKAYDSAIVNLSAKLPVPSTFYQNFQYRIYYEEQLPKHRQFGQDFIYAFTWEDARADQRLLRLGADDVVLCLTSAGDNLLDYLASGRPRRVHAVDLNPNQSHLLELKVAAYQALKYDDFWKLFGEGRLATFPTVLRTKLSPYLSSQALQFWATRANVFTSGGGLYSCGGSGHALSLVRRLLRLAGRGRATRQFCAAKTLAEQRQLWPQLRAVLLSRLLHGLFVGTRFLWRAAGVPAAQAALITNDFHAGAAGDRMDARGVRLRHDSGEAVWQYICDTFDPIARDTLLSEDNFYYLLALHGSYTRRSHPTYVSAKAHARLARPGAFDGLRIHTDEINDVVARLKPASVTVAVVRTLVSLPYVSSDRAAADPSR